MELRAKSAKCSVTRTLALLAAVSCLAPAARAQGERCGVGKDFEFQALEQIKTGVQSEVEDGLQLLKHATEICPSFGDAWYYRSLFERKLGQSPRANYSLDKAKLFGSEAMDSGANPFVLSAPPRPGENKLPSLRNKWALVVGISACTTPPRTPRILPPRWSIPRSDGSLPPTCMCWAKRRSPRGTLKKS
jgi:hypothetical protein